MRLAHKFKMVKKEDRIRFLQARIRNTLKDRAFPGTWVLNDRENRMRRKPLPDFSGKPCYACGQPAVLRHHVVPVSHGGRNKRNNIVPLCHSCHQFVHAAFRINLAMNRL